MDPYLRIATLDAEHEKLCVAYAQMNVELQDTKRQLTDARKQAFLDGARIVARWVNSPPYADIEAFQAAIAHALRREAEK